MAGVRAGLTAGAQVVEQTLAAERAHGEQRLGDQQATDQARLDEPRAEMAAAQPS